MATRDNPVFHIPHSQRLRLRRWQDEAVVYDDFSGDTHLLTRRAYRMLMRLLDGPASRDMLLALDVSDGDECLQADDVVLERLQQLGLCVADAS